MLLVYLSQAMNLIFYLPKVKSGTKLILMEGLDMLIYPNIGIFIANASSLSQLQQEMRKELSKQRRIL